MESMAFAASSSQQKNQESKAFSGIEPCSKRRKVSESSRLFDVFINHRGPDVKQTLATQLYNSLHQSGIRAFLDSQEKELGNSFPSIIQTAILSAKVHIAIFSKGYAESPWCLAELVLMLQSKAKIIPMFYQVSPSDLRHIEKGAYAAAFKRYAENGRYLEKLTQWKEALQSLSFIAGEEFDSSSDCKNIVAAVQEEVKRKTCLHVAEYPVGLNNLVEDFEKHCLDELVQDFETQCGLKTVKNKVVVAGIFGIGGSGKTTLAKELFNRKMSNYFKASFLFDVREASLRGDLHSSQTRLLKDLFGIQHPSFTSTQEGRSYLKDSLQRSPRHLSFLIIVDDIDHVQQLNDLLVMDILKKSTIKKALVIVTTRDVGVLVNAGITIGYNLTGMDKNHGRKLFSWHAFGQSYPPAGYRALVDEFVEVCGGLPLSLQVLGRHVHGRADSYWKPALIKARTMLPRDVNQRLRISFDALDYEQKQVFMDIACFFVGKLKSTAEKVWEASGWNAQHALDTLKDKCLVEEISEIREDIISLRMHDHLRDLGREMALELSPPHRLWRPQDLKSMASTGFKNILTKTNIRCFHTIFDKAIDSQVTFFLGQSHNCDETSASLIWLKLEGNSTEQSSIPSWIPLQNLHYLQIRSGQLKTLWGNNKEAPSCLKELQILENSLKEFQDLTGISDGPENGFLESLEKLVISGEHFVSRISISGAHYPSLESITLEYMGSLMEVDLRGVKSLKSLTITYCNKLTRLINTSHLTNLVLLKINQCPDLEELTLARPCCLERIIISNCQKLKNVLGLSNLTKLVEVDISYCEKLGFDQLCLSGMKFLDRMTFDRHVKVKRLELDVCQNLRALQFGCEELVELSVRGCPELEQLPVFRGPSPLKRIVIDGCRKFKYIQLEGCQHLKTIQFCCEEIVELNIQSCAEVEEVTCFRSPNCMERIIINRCGKLKCLQVDNSENLKTVLGIANVAKLVELEICGCVKQEFDHLCLSGLKSLERIKFDRHIKIKYFELDGYQNLKTIQFGCEELVEFSIRGSPDLEELPVFRGPSFLERIRIDGCEKLKCLQVHDCRVLQTIQLGCEQLAELSIWGCPELEKLAFFRSPNCLKRIKINGCGKLKCLQVDSYQNLKSVLGISNLAKLVELEICSCEKQEFNHLSLLGMKCLERITFDRNVKAKYLEFDGCQILKTVQFDCEELVELSTRGCSELEIWPIVRGSSLLERIIIDGCGKLKFFQLDGCQNLKSVLGISNLAMLVDMKICGCGKLEFDHLCLSDMKCLERMIFDRHVKVKHFEFDGCQNLKIIQFSCKELVELRIRGSPELKELPIFEGPSCLERITINECRKLKCFQLSGCQNLKSVSGNFELRHLHIVNCPELEEVRSDGLSRLGVVEIQGCEKLQAITGSEEWYVSDHMRLCDCKNEVIQSCIRKLKNVWFRSPTVFIGRAVDGADSNLNQDLFSDCHCAADIDSTIRIWDNLSSKRCLIIGCFVVQVDSSASVENINGSLSCLSKNFSPGKIYSCNLGLYVRQGELIITIVCSYWRLDMKIEHELRENGILKKVFWVLLEDGEEGKAAGILRTIVNRLYHF